MFRDFRGWRALIRAKDAEKYKTQIQEMQAEGVIVDVIDEDEVYAMFAAMGCEATEEEVWPADIVYFIEPGTPLNPHLDEEITCELNRIGLEIL